MSNSQFFNIYKPAFAALEEAMAFAGAEGYPVGSVTIGVTHPIADYRILRENSPVFNFEYVSKGRGEVVLGGQTFTVSAGDTYILRAGDRHDYRSDPDDPWEKTWIMFECEYMSAFMDAYGVKSGVYKTDTSAYFDTLVSLSRSGAPFDDICFPINECLQRIVENVASVARKSSHSEASAIRQALSAAVYKKCSLDEIADELHISKSTLIRTFKNAYSVSPYEYLLGAKTDAAKLLLRNSRMTLREIAELLCISDEHGFSAMFYSRTGVRPGAFRKRRGE